MILALMGLHGSGKSYFATSIEAVFKWKVYVKRDLLKVLYEQEGDVKVDWVDWYRKLYERVGPYEVMNKILKLIPESKDPIILDSIHNLAELKALRDMHANNFVLAAVVAPKLVRLSRNDQEDIELDRKRISFWHEKTLDGNISCLFSEADWVFNGCVSKETRLLEFQNFLDYLTSRS